MLILAIGTCLTNAAYYILIRRLNSAWPPFLLGTVFRVECVALIAAYMAWQGRLRLLISEPVRRHLKWLLIVAASNFVIESATIVGLRYTTALNAAVFTRLDVIFAVLLGVALYGERLAMRDLPALVLLCAGCVAVLNARLDFARRHAVGDALIILAAAVIASNAFLIRIRLRSVDREVVAFHNVLYSTVPFAALSAWERPEPLAPMDIALLGVLGAVVFGSYVFYYAALKVMAVWRVRALMLSVPAIVLAASAVTLSDHVAGSQVVGAVLVVLGSALLMNQHAQPAQAAHAIPAAND